MNATCEDLKAKCDRYDYERNEQTTKVELFMQDLAEIEKNLHLALSDKEKVLMDLEKERLTNGQIDFELQDVRQQLQIKNQEMSRIMDEKIRLNSELSEVNRDKLEIISKQEKNFIPEFHKQKMESDRLQDRLITMQKEIDTYEINRQEFLRERENNNQILKMSKEEIQHLQKMLEDLERNADSYVIRQKQDTIDDLIHEKAVVEKDKQFFQLKSDKLEEKLYALEKELVRLDSSTKYYGSEVGHLLRHENDNLRDELYHEKRSHMLHHNSRTLDRSNQNVKSVQDISDHATSENDRVKQLLRRRIDQKLENLSQASNRDQQKSGMHTEADNRSGKRMLNKPDRDTSDIKYAEGGRINTIPRSANSPMGNKLLHSCNSGISGHSGMYNKNIL